MLLIRTGWASWHNADSIITDLIEALEIEQKQKQNKEASNG